MFGLSVKQGGWRWRSGSSFIDAREKVIYERTTENPLPGSRWQYTFPENPSKGAC
jgi:hypothetical protein